MNDLRATIAFGGATLLVLCAGCASAGQGRASSDQRVPERRSHRIAVPFVSFAEAAALEYQDKRIRNPTFAAAVAMVLRYGGQDLVLLTYFRDALPEHGGWAKVDGGSGGTLDELKRFLDRDVPIIVTPTMTSVAHPPGPVLEIVAAAKGVKLRQPITTSGILPPMRSLAELLAMKRSLGDLFSWESLLTHARVVVGYDDTRQVLVMHDPLFGPAVEVPYAEFDQMWAPNDRSYLAVEPRARVAISSDTTSSRRRTSAELAVERFVRSYALESVGNFDAAADLLRGAPADENLPSVLTYLFTNEQAYIAWNLGKRSEALRLADQATSLVPQSPSPWRLRAEIAKRAQDSDAASRRALAEATLERLCADTGALDALREQLVKYVQVWSVGCGVNIR